MSGASPDDSVLRELDELLESLLNDELPPEGVTRLETLLKSGKAVRQRYIAKIHLWSATQPYALVGSALGTANSASTSGLPASSPPPVLHTKVSVTSDKRAIVDPWRWRRKSWMAAAALLAITAICGLAWSWFGSSQPKLLVAGKAKWASSQEQFAIGRPLPSGPLELLEGIAEFKFSSGVQVVVEGPARFEVLSQQLVRLASGKLTALVPPAAHGFAVQSTAVHVIDLGTEFAMTVDSDQSAHVDVIRGSVTARAAGPGTANLPPRTLTADQAIDVHAGTIASSPTRAFEYATPEEVNNPAHWTGDGVFFRSQTRVDLRPYYNRIGFYADGATFDAKGGIDGHGNAYPAQFLDGIAFGRNDFRLGPLNAPNIVAGVDAEVLLTPGRYSRLNVIGAMVNHGTESLELEIAYTDGTWQNATVRFSDWRSPRRLPGETIVRSTRYRLKHNGEKEPSSWYVYGSTVPLDPRKTVKSLHISGKPTLAILAMGMSM